MSKTSVNEFITEIEVIKNDANKYFNQCIKQIEGQESDDSLRTRSPQANYFWNKLSSELQKESENLKNRLISISKKIAEYSSNSPLVDVVDQKDLTRNIKSLRASLRLKKYYYNEANVAHEEGRVIGFIPATQDEGVMHPHSAKKNFNNKIEKVEELIQLLGENDRETVRHLVSGEDINKYRSNSAFIMMWMDDDRPELEDVKETLKAVFNSFGIEAVRADDIEHQDVITKKIIDEIETSEFLVADLTGSRPSVYYEVGYAHAIGKRVILFRKKGTDLHFDLAGYNCPEYENLKDLREQLSKRLESMTGKKPT